MRVDLRKWFKCSSAQLFHNTANKVVIAMMIAKLQTLVGHGIMKKKCFQKIIKGIFTGVFTRHTPTFLLATLV